MRAMIAVNAHNRNIADLLASMRSFTRAERVTIGQVYEKALLASITPAEQAALNGIIHEQDAADIAAMQQVTA